MHATGPARHTLDIIALTTLIKINYESHHVIFFIPLLLQVTKM
jgi:hypothetical protein